MGLGKNTPFVPHSDNTYTIELSSLEKEVLAQTVSELRTLLMAPSDPRLRRLYPCAYAENDQLDNEYQRLMHTDLVSSQLHALDTVENMLVSTSATKEELDDWIRGVNAIRLVLGTALDTQENTIVEMDHPDAPAYAVYDFLSLLVEQALQALTTTPRKWRWSR